jgi:hypothetical protein
VLFQVRHKVHRAFFRKEQPGAVYGNDTGKYLDLDVAAAGNTEVVLAKASLALARHKLRRIEADLTV